ncbi:MAG: hypothetical protein KF884_05815 [Fimbriimonadaceae bacterium]|nr:hypothetical protein [Fimbriimonadaceae bacterium]QYK59602.1 MAG: hypothetical protein KF884_05815 [Fimbriimonadaceae bacterium]
MAQRLEALGIEPPAYLDGQRDWIDRPARLFEAGDYPDKGVSVTPETLESLAHGFDHPVPVLIEHANSPLELGYLTDVRAEGAVLMGTVSLTREANDLIEQSGARSLSLGLSQGLDRIIEVSLVREPRVKSAQMFCEGGLLENSDTSEDEFLDRCVREGKLTPAQRPLARCLFTSLETQWSQGEPLSRLVRRLIQLSPSRQLFGETVPDPPAGGHLDDNAREFYRRHFPGLSFEEIAKRANQ